MLQLNLWLWSRHLHKDLSSFARTEGAQQEQYQKLGVCLLFISASSRGNCYAVCLSLKFYTIFLSAAVLLKWRSWLLRGQLLMISPCAGPRSLKPWNFSSLQPWRKICVVTGVLIGNSLSTMLDSSWSDPRDGWFLSPQLRWGDRWMEDASRAIRLSIHGRVAKRGL